MKRYWVITTVLLMLQPSVSAAECDEYADRLQACEGYKCSFKHPFTGKSMTKVIVGVEEGLCQTREQMPGSMLMECRFDEPYRQRVADYIRLSQAAKKISTEAKVKGEKSQVTTRLDGKRIKNPLQEAMDKGYCQVIMPGKKQGATKAAPAPIKQRRVAPRPKPKPKTVKRPVKSVPSHSSGSARLPDLAVAGMQLDQRCRPVITLEMLGNKGLSPVAYDRSNSAAVQLYRDGKPWQGVALFGFDPRRALMKPNGSVSFTLFQSVPSGTSTRVKVVADSRNQIKERAKSNNSLELRLHCPAE